MRTRVFALIVAVFLAACDGTESGTDAGPDAQAGQTARVELGGGTANFEPIGDTMELVAGPQGGWHFFVTCRLYDLTLEGITLSYAIERDGATISMPLSLVLPESRFTREGDHWLRAGDFVVFDITMPSDVVGDTVTVSVTADPTDGDPVSDSATVMVVDEMP